MKKKIWYSQLPERLQNSDFESFNASISFDVRLFQEEIQATIAHASALHKAGVYSEEEYFTVCNALKQIKKEIKAGNIEVTAYEDIHSLVEGRLTELTGDAGCKIQTARSRRIKSRCSTL